MRFSKTYFRRVSNHDCSLLAAQLVPEFIQGAAQAEAVAAAALGLLRNQDGAGDRVLDGYRRLSDLLGGPGAAGKAAAIVLKLMHSRQLG